MDDTNKDILKLLSDVIRETSKSREEKMCCRALSMEETRKRAEKRRKERISSASDDE